MMTFLSHIKTANVLRRLWQQQSDVLAGIAGLLRVS